MLMLEVMLAVLILSRGRWVKVGIAGAILFLVGISPLGFDIMPNLVLAAALVYLLTQDFPRDAVTMLRDRRGQGSRAREERPTGASVVTRVRGSIEIHRPVEEVFDFVADQRNEVDYNPK